MINEIQSSSSEIALAYAVREYDDDLKYHQIFQHYLDNQYKGKTDEQKAIEIAENAKRAHKIIEVGALNGVSRAIENGYKIKQAGRLFEKTFLPWAEAVGNGQEISSIVTPMSHEFSRLLYQPMNDRSIIHILRLTNGAQRLSQENGKHPGLYFEDDELFSELTRLHYSPTEYIEQYKKFADGFTESAFLEALCSDPRSLAKLVLTTDEVNQFSEDQISLLQQHLKVIFAVQPEVAAMVKSNVESNKSATRGKVLFDVRRFWGNHIISELPTHLQHFLQG